MEDGVVASLVVLREERGAPEQHDGEEKTAEMIRLEHDPELTDSWFHSTAILAVESCCR